MNFWPFATPKPVAAPKPAAVKQWFSPSAIEAVADALAKIPDPDLILQKTGLTRKDLRKLETDDEISAALETRREAVIATPWRLDPYDGAQVEWLWTELAPHIEPLLRGAWSAVPFGYSVLEVVYRQGPPWIGLAEVSEKPLEWFEPKRNGTLAYTDPNTSLITLVDTDYKFLLTRRAPSYRVPYGEALLSRAYWPWFFRHNGWRFWMQFLERFADPLLMGRVFDPTAFVTAVQALGMTNVLGVGKEEDVTAVTLSAPGEFEKVEQALTARIQKLILGQTLTSQIGKSGSYAAAKVHNEVREDKRRADIRLVTATAQRLVTALWRINGFAGEPPTFILQDDKDLDSARAERDAKLVQAGVLTFTEQYILDKYDLTEGDFIIGCAATPAVPATPLTAGQALQLRAKPPQRFTQDQQQVEDLMAASLAQAESPIPAATLRKVISQADSAEDLAERLAALYTGSDAAEFQELLERSLFMADVAGFYTAEKRVGL